MREQNGAYELGPKVIHFAVGFSISYEAGSHLLQHQSTVGTLEAGRMPLEVRSYTQDKLVQDRTAASGTQTRSANSWKTSQHAVGLSYVCDVHPSRYNI